MPLRPCHAPARHTAWLLLWAAIVIASPAGAQTPGGAVTIAPRSAADLRDETLRIDGMQRSGELRVRSGTDDELIEGRTHERSDQYYRGVRVFGGGVARQIDNGLVLSAFGVVYEGIAISAVPSMDDAAAREAVEALGAAPDVLQRPELVVLPLDAGGYALTWRLRAVIGIDEREYFIDARTGAVVLEYSNRKTQSPVGRARGVLGDTKKISVKPEGGRFTAIDELRPPVMRTYDMQSNHTRTKDFLTNRITLAPSDLASDSDNDWTDGAVSDAHVYSGWTYDFFYKRFNRRGLNDANISIRSLVHPIRRSDVFTLFQDYADFYVNAFYFGNGTMVYGEGLPAGVTLGGQAWDYLAGALDIVAHELTHGVTDFSSGLIYRNESGALNEAFSDMMGTATEFFFQPAGSGSRQADYLIGEDVIRPGGLRSMANPAAFDDPDHYSRRYTGTADNGGVHINSGIPNHVFYLAIEGGTNRTSGLAVQGVGTANRDQIEKAFYRAFTQLLPANATFATARAATIQSARDLYGSSSPAERAITQAWTAVGVN